MWLKSYTTALSINVHTWARNRRRFLTAASICGQTSICTQANALHLQEVCQELQSDFPLDLLPGDPHWQEDLHLPVIWQGLCP